METTRRKVLTDEGREAIYLIMSILPSRVFPHRHTREEAEAAVLNCEEDEGRTWVYLDPARRRRKGEL